MTVSSRKDKNTSERRAVWKVLKKTPWKKDLNFRRKEDPFFSHKNYK